MVSNADFARNLLRIMRAKGMSKGDLASALWGKTFDSRGYPIAKNEHLIGAYLRGIDVPDVRTRERIAQILDVAMEDLAAST